MPWSSPKIGRTCPIGSADAAFIALGHGRGSVDRLGPAVALCTMPWLGFVPDDVVSAPRAAVARLADRLGADPDVIRSLVSVKGLSAMVSLMLFAVPQAGEPGAGRTRARTLGRTQNPAGRLRTLRRPRRGGTGRPARAARENATAAEPVLRTNTWRSRAG
ncbi:DUF4158 domain-containing protein [Microbispora sp. KK1-11]|uniref:DUF4158 domain-containing protein n=1 Tax=Microbispora sp. KK1-11 TaxID=2053005 RepID=UPI001C8E316C